MPRRILLIEDDPDYEQIVRAVLAGSAGSMDRVEVKSASSVASGLAAIAAFAPQIILVDLNLADSLGYETFLRVRERASGIPIVVLTGLDDDKTAIRAVEDGAEDYLVKSLVQPKLIVRCLKMAMGRQNRHTKSKAGRPSGVGTVLAFIGSKGGVGTSTVTINVAALLAQHGLDTVMIEFHPGCPGTSALYLDEEPPHGLNSLFRNPAKMITESDLRSCVAETPYGLHVLCPADSPEAVEQWGVDYAHAVISLARQIFPFVVLDLPARLDDGVAEALKLSDSITVIVDREAASLHAGRMFLEQLKAASARMVNVAIVDRTAMQTPLPLAEIKSQIKLNPLVMVPPASAGIALSHAARTPFALLCPHDAFSLAHLELVDRLVPPSARGDKSLAPERRLPGLGAGWRPIPETMYS